MSVAVTKKYEMFQCLHFNRDVKKIAKLEASMKKHGYINAYPLHVVRENGQLFIKGGHHRFHVARNLGLPVAYVICADSASVYELEAATVQWSMEDYLSSYVRLGNPNYAVVSDFQERTGIATGMCVSLLAGELAASGNQLNKFKSGDYVVRNTVYAEAVADLVSALKQVGIKWATDRLCVCSLSRIVSGGIADIDRFKKKIEKHGYLIRKQSSQDNYMRMWEDLYNYKAHGKCTPLVILTNEILKERQRAIFKKRS